MQQTTKYRSIYTTKHMLSEITYFSLLHCCILGAPSLSLFVRVLYPGYCGSTVMAQNLDTAGSLQWYTAREPSTLYWTRPHHSWLKRTGRQPK
jgi:hypothetical protein